VIGALFCGAADVLLGERGRAIDRVGTRLPFCSDHAHRHRHASMHAWPTPAALYLVGTLVGSGLVIGHIAASNAVGAIGAPADRPRNFSLLALGFSGSGFLGPLAAGFMIDGLGHARAFLVLAVFPLVAFLALLLGRLRLPLPAPPLQARRAPARRPARRPQAAAHPRGERAVQRGLGRFVFVAPIYGTALGLSASAIGVAGAFAAATFVVAALPWRWCGRTRNGPWWPWRSGGVHRVRGVPALPTSGC
jgi:MFS family permease